MGVATEWELLDFFPLLLSFPNHLSNEKSGTEMLSDDLLSVEDRFICRSAYIVDGHSSIVVPSLQQHAKTCTPSQCQLYRCHSGQVN